MTLCHILPEWRGWVNMNKYSFKILWNKNKRIQKVQMLPRRYKLWKIELQELSPLILEKTFWLDLNKFIILMWAIVRFFFEKKIFALWILFTLSSLPGLFKFNILFLNISLVLIGILYSGFTGLNNMLYIYTYRTKRAICCFIVLLSSPTIITNGVFTYCIIYIYIYIYIYMYVCVCVCSYTVVIHPSMFD